MSLTRVKALQSFEVAPDGINVQTVAPDTVIDLPTDVAIGLRSLGKVEDAEGADLYVPGAGATRSTVISPTSTATSVEPTELSDEDKAAVAEARVEPVPATEAVRPDIEPVEHGGESFDRMATRGIDKDAKLVETADPAAAIGTADTAAEIVTITENVDPENPAGVVGTSSPAAQEEGKASPDPDNKQAPRRSTKKS